MSEREVIGQELGNLRAQLDDAAGKLARCVDAVEFFKRAHLVSGKDAVGMAGALSLAELARHAGSSFGCEVDTLLDQAVGLVSRAILEAHKRGV